MSSFQFEQIGVIRSPYKEKFAVPRQPGLVKSANGELHLIAPYNQADAVRGLEAFSSFIKRWKAAGVRLCVRLVLAVMPEWVFSLRALLSALTQLVCRW
jgi:tRNA (Thr-GGU) A37 N-methylase